MPLAQTAAKKDDTRSADKPFQSRPLPNGMTEYLVQNIRFTVPRRYVLKKKLGSGSYGTVCSANDTETGEVVAIKRCENVFKHCEDGKRVLREVKMMSMLDHRNTLPIKDVFVGEAGFNDVYVVTPCLDTDLSQLIKNYSLSEQHIKYILYQILRGLRFVHSADMLHRDLKPANILVDYDCHAKLCDFGLARGCDPDLQQDMTSYIVTRWYRAPELLLNSTKYNGAIDIWAVGCIFAEMWLGKPLFCGGSSLQQLQLITSTVPVPEQKDLMWVKNSKCRTALPSGSIPTRPLHKIMGATKISPAAMELLGHMLHFNPNSRWTAERLMEHPYLEDVRSGRHHEPSAYRFKWKWDSITNLTEPILRKLYWEELVRFEVNGRIAPPNTRPSTPVAVRIPEHRRQRKASGTEERAAA